ncbi:MAG TPA: RagB/SusD family nutrient uptake outer membrane protein, partial [Cyclobacteriaceae bacterium]|nr:RagB/SusD family nutrient uptake outer membrane protein [Cyclobacteriaceae bacterium]
MKSIKYIFLLFIIGFQSCQDDVLEREPLDKIPEGNVWNDEVMINAYVTNLYSRFPFFAFEQQNWYSWTDEGTRSTGNASNIAQGTVSRSSEGAPYWDYAYIRDINVFLERIGPAEINEAVKQQLEGEVRFIRAYTYFEMMKRYGGVPLVDVVIDPFNPIDKQYTVRTTEEAIADFIKTELNTAIGLLNENPAPKGRINKWTAHALKARA